MKNTISSLVGPKNARFVAVLGIVVAVALICLSLAEAEDKPSPTKERPDSVDNRSVEDLLKQLGSEDFETREMAAVALGKRPEAFVPLHHAIQSDDPELVKRAQAAIEQLRPIFRKRALARLKETLDRGEVDLFVDRFVHLRDDLAKEDWKAL